MPPRYTVVPLKPAADENAPRAPSPHHHRSRRSSIAAPASLLSQRPRRMSLADRKAMNIAELLASSSPLPPPPRMRDVDALVKTPGKEQEKPRSKRRAGRKAKSPPPAAAHRPRRTSRDMDELFAALELMPTSSPLPPRPVIRTEEELAAKAEEMRAAAAAAAAAATAAEQAKKTVPRRHLRPALAEKTSNEGKKNVLRVQTKAQRLDLGARAKAVAAELQRKPVSAPAAPSTPPQASRKRVLTPLRSSPTVSSLFDTYVD